jgi:hypothetical protein
MRVGKGGSVVLVRGGVAGWLLTLVALGLLVFAILAPWATARDQAQVSEVAACLSAFCWAGCTSRYQARGSALVCVGMTRVFVVEAAAIERIEAELAPTVVTLDGRRWSLPAFRMSYTTGWGGRVTRRRVALLQNWLDEQPPSPLGGAIGVRRGVRWSTVVVGLLAAGLAPLVPWLASAIAG